VPSFSIRTRKRSGKCGGEWKGGRLEIDPRALMFGGVPHRRFLTLFRVIFTQWVVNRC